MILIIIYFFITFSYVLQSYIRTILWFQSYLKVFDMISYEHMVEMCPCVSVDDEWLSQDDQALVEFGEY